MKYVCARLTCQFANPFFRPRRASGKPLGLGGIAMSFQSRLGGLALATFCALCAQAALAGTWQKSLRVPVTESYESNPLLRSNGGQSAWTTTISPSIKLSDMFELDQFNADLAVHEVRSSNTAARANRTDPRLSLSWLRQLSRGSFGLSGSYERESTRTSELQDTGLIYLDSTRTEKSIQANSQYMLSERSTLAGHVQYDDVSYNNRAFTDYKTSTANLNLNYQYSETLQPYAGLSATHYVPGTNAFNLSSSDQYMLQGGLKWRYSPTTDATFYLGSEHTSGVNKGSGGVGGVTLHHATALSDLSLAITRSVSPSGLGSFVKADQVTGNWSYALAERDKTGVDLTWRKNDDIYRTKASQVGAWFSHEWSQDWSTKLGYRHRILDQLGVSGKSDEISVSLIYIRPEF